MTGVSISGSKNCVVDAYSYFEKGCRKKCTRQSRKVLWVILRSLFFKESQDRMAGEAMDLCLRVLKESNKSRFDSGSVREQCIDHIPYYLSGLSRAHACTFFRTTLLEIAVDKILFEPWVFPIIHLVCPPKFYISIASIEIKNIP